MIRLRNTKLPFRLVFKFATTGVVPYWEEGQLNHPTFLPRRSEFVLHAIDRSSPKPINLSDDAVIRNGIHYDNQNRDYKDFGECENQKAIMFQHYPGVVSTNIFYDYRDLLKEFGRQYRQFRSQTIAVSISDLYAMFGPQAYPSPDQSK